MEELLETRRILHQILTVVGVLVPEEFSLSYLADSTGKSRQALTKYLQRNYEEGVEWEKKGKKIFVKKELGIKILQAHKVQLVAA